MPRWFSGYQSRFLVTDLFGVTTTWLDRLTLGASLAFNLDQPMTGTISLHSNDPRVNRIFTDGDPLVAQSNRLIYAFLRQGTAGGSTAPWQCVAAGIIMSPEDQADQDVPTTHLSFFDAWQFLFGTPCFADISGTLPGPDGFQFFATPGSQIVATLLGNAIFGSEPTVPGTAGNGYFIDAGVTYGGTVHWAGVIDPACPPIDFVVQQGMSIGDAWNQLLAAGNDPMGGSGGLDIVLTPIYDPIYRPGYTHELSVLNLAGIDNHSSPMAWGMFTRSAETADRQHDGTPGAFVDIADFYAGQGGPGVGLVQNFANVSKYLGYWSQKFFPQQPDALSVRAMAQQAIQLQKQGKRTFTVNPDPLRAIGPFVGYNLGDRIPIYAPNKLRVTAAGLQRVQGIPLEINPDGVARVNALLTSPDWRGSGGGVTPPPPGPPPPPPPPPPATGDPWSWDAATASLDPNSAALIAAFQTYAVAAGDYFAAEVSVEDAPGGTTSYAIPTSEVISPVSCPVPIGTRPGASNDLSMTVRLGATDYDISLAVYNTGTGKITGCFGATVSPITAVYEAGPCVSPGNCNSANAACFPLRQGLITPGEITAGLITHPLVFSMPNCGPAPNRYPARPGSAGYPGNTGFPLGTWLRLNPTFNVAGSGLPAFEKMICVALQTFGMFLRDIGTTLAIIGVDPVNQGAAYPARDTTSIWAAAGVTLNIAGVGGVDYAVALDGAFPWTSMQVLQAPSP